MASISGENDPSFERKLRDALSLDLPYTERFLRPSNLHAAVLAVFARDSKDHSLLLIRRAAAPDPHGGQMAFPGGRCEPDELERRAFAETALRETEEEVGIPRSELEVLGRLHELSTGTGFRVEPFVALARRPVSELALKAHAAEIAETIWVPWETLLDPAIYQREWFERGEVRFPTHVFYVGPHRIWGATGAMIKNLLDRWKLIG